MEISAIIAFIFLLPGYISYLVVKQFTVGFGRDSSVFDKTLLSLIFDIPIFLLTLAIFNWKYFIDAFSLSNYGFDGFKDIDQFTMLMENSLFLLVILAIVVLISSLFTGLIWILALKIPTVVSRSKAFLLKRIFKKDAKLNIIMPYSTIWKNYFTRPAEPIPVEIYCLSKGDLIVEGFLVEASQGLNNNLEFKVSDMDLFQEFREEKIIETLDFVYINNTQRLKINVYSQDGIKKYEDEFRREDNVKEKARNQTS